MDMVRVKSSNIRAIGYDATRRVMEIHFHAGKVDAKYSFKDVPGSVFEEFIKAESKGKFFVKEVKGKYVSETLE